MQLCLGTVQFGTQYGIQGNAQPNRQETFKMISYALEHDVYWFDTAAAYGIAEELLGEYIKENPSHAEKMSIVSKLAPSALVNVPENRWRDIILADIQGSLKRLHKHCLDAYIFHNASCIFNSNAVKALDRVHQEGLAKTIGVSVYTPQEAMQALAYPQIDVIQVPYNVFDRRLDQNGFFSEAHKRGKQVYARSSLLQGLAVMEPEYLPDYMQFARPYLTTFHEICRNTGVSPLHAAIGFVSAHPGIDYLLFGVDSLPQLSEYLFLVSMTLPSEVGSVLNTAFEVVPEKLVNPSLWIQ